MMRAARSSGSADAVEFLIRNGADVNAVGGDPAQTAFDWACRYHRYDMAELLLKYGAKGKMPDPGEDRFAYKPRWYEAPPRTLLLYSLPIVAVWLVLFAVLKPRK